MSNRSLEDLDSRVKDKARALYTSCSALGIDIIFTETYRSNERQASLYAQGRTEPGDIVTYKKPGESSHNHGLAFDIAFLEPDRRGVTWQGPWELVGLMGEHLGLTWGGRWEGLRDKPHFELQVDDSNDQEDNGNRNDNNPT